MNLFFVRLETSWRTKHFIAKLALVLWISVNIFHMFFQWVIAGIVFIAQIACVSFCQVTGQVFLAKMLNCILHFGCGFAPLLFRGDWYLLVWPEKNWCSIDKTCRCFWWRLLSTAFWWTKIFAPETDQPLVFKNCDFLPLRRLDWRCESWWAISF